MNLYLWETDIGRFAAQASDSAQARRLILANLSASDAMYGQLADAIECEPVAVSGEMAVLAWQQ